MTLHALDAKLIRDLWRLRGQAVAIALVLACGVAIFLISSGMIRALEATRDDYYGQQRFADLFASANRAPRSLLPELSAIDGVQAAELRIADWVVLDLPGREAPASGRVLSLPPEGAVLNVPIVVSGQLPDPGSDGQVAVSARFAEANGFRPGDSFGAIAGGKRLELTITGTLRSPEYIYALPPGGLMPDDKGFGVIWMPERAAEAVFDMAGAFNDLSLALRRDADEGAVIERVDALLDDWGSTGAYARETQISHAFITAEIDSLKSMAVVLPPVFFGIAAFLVNMVLGRVVSLERSEIGLLKALGYRNTHIAVHYLMLAALIAAVGVLVGWGIGTWLARGMALLYAEFYDFPWLVRAGSPGSYALSGLIGILTAAVGAIRAALAAANLPPAVAMAPPAPPRFRRGLLDRILTALGLSQPAMMVLRGILRWPVRAGMTVLGLAFGVSMIVASGFFGDSLDKIVTLSFYQANRQHVTLTMAGSAPLSVVDDAAHLPGVLRAEPEFMLPVTLHNGHKAKDATITARPPAQDLVRTVDPDGAGVEMPVDGLLLSRSLADDLGLRVGDLVRVERRDGSEEEFTLPVAAITAQFLGFGAYMELDALSARLMQAPRVTAVNLSLDEKQLPEFRRALKDLPNLGAASMVTEVRDSFRDTIEQNMTNSTVIFYAIAVLISAGVAYNGARIQLSERSRELASLRILGFTRAEVSSILLGEIALLALLAQPLGWAIGAGVAWLMTTGFDSDLYRIPLVLTSANFANASLVALGSVAAAGLLVRRRLDRADLVSVMKTRE